MNESINLSVKSIYGNAYRALLEAEGLMRYTIKGARDSESGVSDEDIKKLMEVRSKIYDTLDAYLSVDSLVDKKLVSSYIMIDEL